MKHKETLFARYPDLLDEQADAETQALVQQLDVVYTTPSVPAHLTLARALEGRAAQPEGKRQARKRHLQPLARWFFAPRPLPQRLASIAIALLLALLLTVGSTYAVGTILDKVFNLEPGTHQIAVRNLYQPINQSQTIQGFTITVEQGYADSNRVIVAFTVKKPAGHVYNHVSPEGVTLTTQGGLVLPYYYGDGYGNKAGDEGYANFFDASSITGNLQELHLHLVVQVLDIAQQDGDDSTLRTYQISGPVSFDFSLTFHPGRIANPHQTITIGSTPVTLERVVVTLSETRIYLRGVNDRSLVVRLAVDGWDSEHGPVGPIGTISGKDPGSGKNAGSSDQAIIFFSVSLYDKHGEWALAVTSSGGTGTFHFVVP